MTQQDFSQKLMAITTSSIVGVLSIMVVTGGVLVSWFNGGVASQAGGPSATITLSGYKTIAVNEEKKVPITIAAKNGKISGFDISIEASSNLQIVGETVSNNTQASFQDLSTGQRYRAVSTLPTEKLPNQVTINLSVKRSNEAQATITIGKDSNVVLVKNNGIKVKAKDYTVTAIAKATTNGGAQQPPVAGGAASNGSASTDQPPISNASTTEIPPVETKSWCDAGGRRGHIYWSAVSDTTFPQYAFRIDDQGTQWPSSGTQAHFNSNCNHAYYTSTEHDYCSNVFKGLNKITDAQGRSFIEFDFDTIPGHKYAWWFHPRLQSTGKLTAEPVVGLPLECPNG